MIYKIALARIQELSELIFFKNVNLKYYNENSKNIYLEVDQNLQYNCFKEIYKNTFSKNGSFDLHILEDLPNESLLKVANELVHFGWKKEAIPFTQSKKSVIARFFDTIFG